MSEVHIRGFQQMAVKAKSGMQMSSGPPGQGCERKVNNLFVIPRVIFSPVKASIHLNQKDRKRLGMM